MCDIVGCVTLRDRELQVQDRCAELRREIVGSEGEVLGQVTLRGPELGV